MFQTQLKTALRCLWRHKGFSLINLLGLSAGMAVSFTLLLYVYSELSYDRYHQRYDQLYQVWHNMEMEGSIVSGDRVPSPVAGKIEQTLPGIGRVARTFPQAHWLTRQNTSLKQQGYYADPAFLEMFSFRFVAGNARTALKEPNSIVLTQSLAKALFGNGNPLGQLLTFEHKEPLVVRGVIEDLPRQSTLGFHFLVPWSFWEKYYAWKSDQEWGYYSFPTFVELSPQAEPARVAGKLRGLITRHQPEQTHVTLFLHPMRKWHLYSQFEEGRNVGGSISYVRLYAALALGILLVACVNFMNLATARSGQRAREIGVRKAIGAGQLSLVSQFLLESLLVSFLAAGVALILVVLSLPLFNQWLGTALSVDSRNPYAWGVVLSVALLTGLLSGSYPAFYLSSFRPVAVLKGTFRAGSTGLLPRQGLVVVQFSFSICLLISTFFIYKQLRYIQHRPVGYQKAGLIDVSLEGKLKDHFAQFRQDLLQTGAIVEACATSSRITEADSQTSIEWPGQRPEEQFNNFHQLEVGHSFVATFGVRLTRGRGFSSDLVTDTVSVLINETARKVMRLDHPVGQIISWQGEKRQIVGVFADFVWDSPFEPAQPMVVACRKGGFSYCSIRLPAGRSLEAALQRIKTEYKRYNPALPFAFTFVEEAFAQKFAFEKRVGILSNVFAGLAMFISCLGLLGLAAFTSGQRLKEVSIRKVFGARPGQLWLLLSWDFMRLVAVSFLLAAPASYWLIAHWLDQYTYHTPLSPWVFVTAGVAALAAALLTVSLQTIKAALTNPVQALRGE
jgi:ABC-type antimicrobial peptide transport system permease subunit